MATVRDFQVNNGLEVNLNANVVSTLSASDFIQSNPERPYAPTVVFDFSKSQTLDPRITFIRASNATYTTANGLIATAGNNVPRFQFENGQNQGLLIESQRTNLYKYSTDIFSATSDQRVSGSYMFYDGSIGIRQVSLGTVANQDYAQSVYVKVNTQSDQVIIFDVGDGNAGALNANAATIGQWTRLTNIARQGVNGDFFDMRVNNPKIPLVVNQVWYGVSAYFATQNYGIAPNGKRESTRISWTCTDNTLFDMEIWGFQVEAGSYVTSFIPTTTTSVTRVYDLAYVENAKTVLKLNPVQGAFLFVGKTYKQHNANTPSYDVGTCGLMLQDANFGTQNNYFSIVYRDDTINQLSITHTSTLPGVFTGTSTGGGSNFLYPNTEVRAVASYQYTSTVKQYSIAGSSNGVSNTSSAANFITGVSPPFNYLVFGQNYGFNNRMWHGTIKKVAYYPRALSNSEVISLTTI